MASYVRSPDTDLNNGSETAETDSVPASVNSLSE